MASILKISVSGYYAWLKRQRSSQPDRDERHRVVKEKILNIYTESKGVYGSRKITRLLKRQHHITINHKSVEKIMRETGIRSVTRSKHKATTNSKHNLPVSENLLARQFYAEHPGEKMVSDITYIHTDEGWLYLAAIMDLCGRKIVGTAMSDRMKKDLVIDALKDTVGRTGAVKGCVLHSDRGTQYCSTAYQNLLKAYGFKSSMSRKGNCWDNAPMESFWGKLKQEWLYLQHFKTREEAKAAVFEYIWVFYNRRRVHAANNYMTPEEYYNLAA